MEKENPIISDHCINKRRSIENLMEQANFIRCEGSITGFDPMNMVADGNRLLQKNFLCISVNQQTIMLHEPCVLITHEAYRFSGLYLMENDAQKLLGMIENKPHDTIRIKGK